MFIRESASTEASVATELEYECSGCGYEGMGRVATTGSGSKGNVDPGYAVEMARDEASAAAWQAAFEAVAAAPCPRCGARERRTWWKHVLKRLWSPLGWACLVAMVGSVAVSLLYGHATGAQRIPDSLPLGTMVGAFLLTLGAQLFVRARRFDQFIAAISFSDRCNEPDAAP